MANAPSYTVDSRNCQEFGQPPRTGIGPRLQLPATPSPHPRLADAVQEWCRGHSPAPGKPNRWGQPVGGDGIRTRCPHCGGYAAAAYWKPDYAATHRRLQQLQPIRAPHPVQLRPPAPRRRREAPRRAPRRAVLQPEGPPAATPTRTTPPRPRNARRGTRPTVHALTAMPGRYGASTPSPTSSRTAIRPSRSGPRDGSTTTRATSFSMTGRWSSGRMLRPRERGS